MAITKSYALDYQISLDMGGLTSAVDAVGLDGGGLAMIGDSGAASRSLFLNNDGVQSSANRYSGSGGAVAQLATGNVVLVRQVGNDIAYSIRTADDTVVRPTTRLGEMGYISNLDVAAISNDGFVIAYEEAFSQDDSDIRLMIRNADGSAAAPIITVAETDHLDQGVSVAALEAGGFAVAWHRTVGGATQLWYAIYESNGDVRKAATLLDDFGSINRNASVVGLESGGFAIAYEDDGWPGGDDSDITLARLDASGGLLDFHDISDNGANDKTPSATLLSNGMIMVGSLTTSPGGFDPHLILVDPDNGARLASLAVPHDGTSSELALAGMALGRFGAFHTNQATGDTTGSLLQAVRTTNGDDEDNALFGDSLRDIIFGAAGADVIDGGGNADALHGGGGDDTFIFVRASSTAAGETVDGGSGSDLVHIMYDVNLAGVGLLSIERMLLGDGSGRLSNPGEVVVGAGQIGAGLASNLQVEGGERADTFQVAMGAAASVNLSQMTFTGFVAGYDRIVIVGDGDAEIIFGSDLGDDIRSFGGNDRLNGGGGTDALRGGLGNDIYTVDATGEAIETSDQGVDTVRATIGYTLGNHIERLELIGTGNTNGRGNALGNVITGNDGENSLNGLGGKDLLTGGAGADDFLFTTLLDPLTNIDRITDFEAGFDRIRLDDAIFAGLTNAGRADAFHVGNAAADASDRIIYNAETGALFFDPDGAGGARQVRFATLDPGLALSATDFIIV